MDVSGYEGKYVSVEVVFASNDPNEDGTNASRSILIDTTLYNSDDTVNSSSTYLKRVDSTSKTDKQTLSYSKLIESTDTAFYIVSYKSVNIYSLAVSVSDEDPNSSLEHVHDYKENWTWTATDAGYDVSLTLTCESTVGICDAPEITTQTAVTATLDESASTAATCTVDGQNVYEVEIELNGEKHSDSKTDIIKAAHTYPDNGDETHVVWNWGSTPNADKKVSVTISCSVCGETLETLTTAYSVDTSDNSLWRAEVAGANGVTYTGTHTIPDITSSSVATAEEFASVLATEGNLEITLTADIADDGSAALLTALNTALASGEESRVVTINLGANTLTLNEGNVALNVGAGNTLEIVGETDENGGNAAKLVVTQDFGGSANENLNKSNICADDGSKVTLKNIDVTANGTALYVCSGATLTVEGCDIFTTGGYGVGTNAVESGNAVITLKDSTVTVQKSEGDTATQWTARTGVFVNVSSEVTIESCVITSTFQGLVLRGGTATVTNTEIVITDDFDTDTQSSAGWENYYTADYGVESENSWGTGNTLPHAAIVVGNNGSSAYDTPATLTLDGVEIELESSNAWAIYAYSCSGSVPVVMSIQNCGYSIEYLGNTDLGEGENLHVYCGVSNEGSITVNESVLGYKPNETTIVSVDFSDSNQFNNNTTVSSSTEKGLVEIKDKNGQSTGLYATPIGTGNSKESSIKTTSQRMGLQLQGKMATATDSTTGESYVIYGVACLLQPGTYRVTFKYFATSASDRYGALWGSDMKAISDATGNAEKTTGSTQDSTATYEFTVSEEGYIYIGSGNNALYFTTVEIVQMS